MFFLIAGLTCSALVSIILKISGRYEYDRYGMLTVNYVACLIPFLLSQLGRTLPIIDSDFWLCIVLAIINGFLFLGGMVMNQINVKRNGAILQSTFARLGVMVPTCVSIILFGERPTAIQIIAIVIVLIAFCIMNIPETRTNRQKPIFSLLLLGLMFGGIADSMLKVFDEFGLTTLDDWFMGFTFLFSALICLVITLINKGHIGKREILIGVVLGIPNYLSSLFLLKSISSIDAYIAYPTYSVGAILLVMAVSTIFFKERISRWSKVGVIMIITAIVLLNI